MQAAELLQQRPDVLVVGAGNAALCAAISAHENGARVLMLEAAPLEERGGNSHFTGGAFRFAYGGGGGTPIFPAVRSRSALGGAEVLPRLLPRSAMRASPTFASAHIRKSSSS